MQNNVAQFPSLTAGFIDKITDYLATARSVGLLFDLPLFMNARGHYVALKPRGLDYTFASPAEIDLFGSANSEFLKLETLSANVRNLLLSGNAPNVHEIRGSDVAQYLSKLYARFRSTSSTISLGVEQKDVLWLIKFWEWANTWPRFTTLCTTSVINIFKTLCLIPLSSGDNQGKLRRFGHAVYDGQALNETMRQALILIGVPVLHPALTMSPTKPSSRLLETTTTFLFILDNIPPLFASHALSDAARHELHIYFTDALVQFLRQRQNLSPAQQKTLRSLPIFPVLPGGPRPNNASLTIYDAAPADACFVDGSVKVLPIVPSGVFIDGGAAATLAQALNSSIMDEVQVLKMVLSLNVWNQQKSVDGLVDLLVDRLVRLLPDFDAVSHELIANLPIIDVGGQARASPSFVVDPTAKIAALFDLTDGVLPQGRFAKDGIGSLLQQFRSFGMLRNTLTDFTVAETINKIAGNQLASGERKRRALVLLTLLEDYASSTSISPALQNTLRGNAWLPANNAFFKPISCWDSRRKDRDLVDLVLREVPYTVHNASLRQALGWDIIPITVLHQQFNATVTKTSQISSSASDKPPARRIISIMKELAQRFDRLEVDNNCVQDFVISVGDYPWVPTALDDCVQPERTFLKNASLGSRFQRAHSLVIEGKGTALLRAMGVPDL